MKVVSTAEAEAKFASLLNDVERGETVEITRHGRTIARLAPAANDDQASASEAVRKLKEWRHTLPEASMTIEDILSARDEGRK
jgi:prevent-host-death family protein